MSPPTSFGTIPTPHSTPTFRTRHPSIHEFHLRTNTTAIPLFSFSSPIKEVSQIIAISRWYITVRLIYKASSLLCRPLLYQRNTKSFRKAASFVVSFISLSFSDICNDNEFVNCNDNDVLIVGSMETILMSQSLAFQIREWTKSRFHKFILQWLMKP